MITDHELPNGLTIAQINPRETDALYREIFDRTVYLCHGLVTPPAGAIVDVGANIGLATLFFHCRCPRVPIIAAEPADLSRSALERNVERFSIDAQVVGAALGASRGSRRFTFYPSHTVYSGLHTSRERDIDASVEGFATEGNLTTHELDELRSSRDAVQSICEVLTLGELLGRAGVRQVGLLKIDAERSEDAILAGIPPDLWPHIAQIVVEVHDGPDAAASASSLLMERGMTVVVDIDSTGDHLLYGINP